MILFKSYNEHYCYRFLISKDICFLNVQFLALLFCLMDIVFIFIFLQINGGCMYVGIYNYRRLDICI